MHKLHDGSMNLKVKSYVVYVLVLIAFILATIENITFSSITSASNSGVQEIVYGFITKINSLNATSFTISPFLPLIIANLVLFYGRKSFNYLILIPLTFLLSGFIYETIIFKTVSSFELLADINIGVFKMTYITWDGQNVLNHSTLSPNLFYTIASLTIVIINIAQNKNIGQARPLLTK